MTLVESAMSSPFASTRARWSTGDSLTLCCGRCRCPGDFPMSVSPLGVEIQITTALSRNEFRLLSFAFSPRRTSPTIETVDDSFAADDWRQCFCRYILRGVIMKTFKVAKEMERIKNQQAGRRLSGNQQRALTREQARHQERVESTVEKIQEREKRRDKRTGLTR